jgi:hypothetical protein
MSANHGPARIIMLAADGGQDLESADLEFAAEVNLRTALRGKCDSWHRRGQAISMTRALAMRNPKVG